MLSGARFHWLEHHLHDLAVGFPLRGRHRLSVDIHRRLDRRVTHQLLLHLHRRAGLVQPRTVRVAERVPADSPVLPGNGLTLILLLDGRSGDTSEN
jgi:hypothetical protein